MNRQRIVAAVAVVLAAGAIGLSAPVSAEAQAGDKAVVFAELQAQIDQLTAALAAEEATRAEVDNGLSLAIRHEVRERERGDARLTEALEYEDLLLRLAIPYLDTRITRLQASRTVLRPRNITVDAHTNARRVSDCFDNEQITGGGWIPADGETSNNRAVTSSGPNGNASWSVTLRNGEDSGWSGLVYAVCAPVYPPSVPPVPPPPPN